MILISIIKIVNKSTFTLKLSISSSLFEMLNSACCIDELLLNACFENWA